VVDNIKMDLGEIGWGGVDWIGLAQDRDRVSKQVSKQTHVACGPGRSCLMKCSAFLISSLQMKVVGSSQMLVTLNTSWHHVPEDSSYILHCKDMKPKIVLLLLYFIDWKPTPKTPSKEEPTKPKSTKTPKGKDKPKKDSASPVKEANKDDTFREFRRLCAALSDTDSYTGKTALVKEFFTEGTDGSEYRKPLPLHCTTRRITVLSVVSCLWSHLGPEPSCLE
jgi:hypothetical protein